MTYSRHHAALTAQISIVDALYQICRQQLGTIEQHLPGALLGHDPEELHDLRVAVRRTRTVLGEFRKFFPEEILFRFRTEFRWIAVATGPVRDLDVYLQILPDYQKLLPADTSGDLEPFHLF